ncbi:hypothetical protein P168DRAFT_140248 [Aspergillus campestris IBT 28561]|uniref:Uncharacterized protein n=1 Tax=Aspergillus campestris (strain IBT 28561) TaxID=1392248 RepID=A0A2I1D4M5_ASPC2|nr:uncharacterized protein P168DRAFT_140248 [Aspergillus campestris IBT 28561]PKY04837.1 hypothetical protein P168DRAFT_140248 [Aspergillus campestris IBT 28561]
MTFKIPIGLIDQPLFFFLPLLSFLSLNFLFTYPISSLHGLYGLLVALYEPDHTEPSPQPLQHSGPYRPFPPSGLDWNLLPRGIGLFCAKESNDPLLTAVS